MPILKRESDIFPDDEIFSMSNDAAPWEIAHVRSRQEKTVVRALQQRRQPHYLPQIEKKIRRAGRTFTSYLPLFPGYVFVRSIAGTREALWASGGVVQALPVADQNLLNEQLKQIRALQLAGAVLVPATMPSVGDSVRVTEGVFAGYTGTVLRQSDALRLVVSITAIGKSVIAELPPTALKASETGAPHRTQLLPPGRN